MGIFSFLKKKDDPEQRLAEDRHDFVPPPDTRLRGEPSRLSSADRARQREIARATAAKIDEIELAFESDIFNDEPAWGSDARHPASSLPASLPPEEIPDAAASPASAPAVDESAILYANGQADAAEHLLRDALDTLGRHERLPWWMLFDLYQADGREQAFESVAIDYASHFETSPPTWKPLPAAGAEAARPAPALAASEVFDTVLSAASDARLQRVLQATTPTVRLDFGRVRQVDEAGAASLLAALQTLRAGKRELVLAGADTLLATLRPMLSIGVRDSSQAPWLLLLELLLLTNNEKEFEEAAMDYCVTYEVSPPSFETPHRVSTAATAAPPAKGDRFMLPSTITSRDGALFDAIDAYASERDTLVLDCSRLARIDYAGATLLQSRLEAGANAGKRVELRELSHLVTALLRLLGIGRTINSDNSVTPDNPGGAILLYPHRY